MSPCLRSWQLVWHHQKYSDTTRNDDYSAVKLKIGSGVHWEKANWFQSAHREGRQELPRKKLEKKQAIYVGQFREWPTVNCHLCRDMSDAYSDTVEHLPLTVTRAERISPNEEKKSLISQRPTYAACHRARNIILKSTVLKSDGLKKIPAFSVSCLQSRKECLPQQYVCPVVTWGRWLCDPWVLCSNLNPDEARGSRPGCWGRLKSPYELFILSGGPTDLRYSTT